MKRYCLFLSLDRRRHDKCQIERRQFATGKARSLSRRTWHFLMQIFSNAALDDHGEKRQCCRNSQGDCSDQPTSVALLERESLHLCFIESLFAIITRSGISDFSGKLILSLRTSKTCLACSCALSTAAGKRNRTSERNENWSDILDKTLNRHRRLAVGSSII